MKTKYILASFVAAVSGLALANPAKADLRINLNLGLPRPPLVIVSGRGHDAPHHVSSYSRGFDSCDVRETAPRGYWKEITVKTWVPARWIVSRDRRGREFRTLENGHFAFRSDRVWVDNGRGSSGGYTLR